MHANTSLKTEQATFPRNGQTIADREWQPGTLKDLASVHGAELEQASAADRIRWAVDTFGDRLVLSTSFGVQSAVMLHLASQIKPDIPVIFVDTGYLFTETYQFAEQLRERLDLNLKTYVPRQTAAQQEALFGKLWEQGEDGLKRYGAINKVEPMDRALKEHRAVAWLSGLRRTQSSTRQELGVIAVQAKTLKVHPIIDWSDREVYHYLKAHDLPYHPLWEQGYVSVGDWHSTSRLMDGMREEDTRHGGIKRECGLHELSGMADYQI